VLKEERDMKRVEDMARQWRRRRRGTGTGNIRRRGLDSVGGEEGQETVGGEG